MTPMDQAEREQFKKDAWRLYHNGKTISEKARGLMMIIEAHHDRNSDAPDLDLYASHWLWAARGDYDKDVLEMLIAQFPLPSRPRIQRGYSDWNSYGRPEYKVAA
jgi:hypothetical protein